jgi:prepilin-type N-terminal cleavage/methylation domain-containing protein
MISFGHIYNFRQFRQRGFTLIELLIVTAILGLLAGVCIPNVAQFMSTGTMNSANTELENVKTASVAYYANKSVWPENSDQLFDLLNGRPKAVYSFDTNTGFVKGASDISWSGITWITPSGPPFTQHGEWTK